MNKSLLIFAFLFFAFNLNSKAISSEDRIENETEKQIICYNDPFSYNLESNTAWEVKSSSGKLINSGLGAIKDLIFNEPGLYELNITESYSECGHHHPSKIILEVSSYKLKFDFNSIQFNREIIGGQSQDGNTLSIDVFYSNINNDNFELNNNSIKSAGIGANIEGKLSSEKTILKPGLNHLVYNLTGIATSNTYIMFDFIDLNNQVVSYSYPSKIK